MKTANDTWYDQSTSIPLKLRRRVRTLLAPVVQPLLVQLTRWHRQVRMGDVVLRTAHDVFHPKYYLSSEILAKHVSTLPLRNRAVLDMGTGSGLIGITAAKQNAIVTAVDINPRAVESTKANARLNGVESSIRFIHGDLFESIDRSAEFDWIVFNPPFFAKAPNGIFQKALYSGSEHETIQRFLQQAKIFLTANGRVLMVLSSDMDLATIDRLIKDDRYRIERLEIKPHIFENFFLIHLMPEKADS